jgi:hypothetical protein
VVGRSSLVVSKGRRQTQTPAEGNNKASLGRVGLAVQAEGPAAQNLESFTQESGAFVFGLSIVSSQYSAQRSRHRLQEIKGDAVVAGRSHR